MLKGKLPKPVLCSVISSSKFSLKTQTALFISTPPNSQRTSRGCQGSRAGCHALPMEEPCAPFPVRLVAPHRPSTPCNLVLWCWHPPGLSELPLPKHSTPPWGKPPLLALQARAGSGGFLCSAASTGRGPGLVYTAGYSTALISPSHRMDIVISNKGKIYLERDLATHCLILVFWYFRYKNACPLLTALCSRFFIAS